MSGIVYVLTNPAMPGLVKVGRTTKEDVRERMKELYGTSVPVQFECPYACRVDDPAKVEKNIHLAFGAMRVSASREFFRLDPENVIAILTLLDAEDVTPDVEKELEEGVTPAEKESANKLKRSRRPQMNFVEMGIPEGSTLLFKDGTATCTVIAAKKVYQNGHEYSLTALTSEILEIDYQIQPAPHWTYEGRTLKDIYEDTYSTEE